MKEGSENLESARQEQTIPGNEADIIPEYSSLPVVTQKIIKELGAERFLAVIFAPSRSATAGDAIWSLFNDSDITNNGQSSRSTGEELQFQYRKDKSFQNLIAQKMGLEEIFKSSGKEMGARTLSEALEGLLGALWYQRGGPEVPIPWDLAREMLDLVSEKERSARKPLTDEEEILHYYPTGEIRVTTIPGTKQFRAEVLVDGKIVASVDRRGAQRAKSALAGLVREQNRA